MSFLNPLPLFFWLIPTIPLIIFLINRRNYKVIKFSSIEKLVNLKTNEINRIKILNILLLLLRTLILISILIILMRPYLDEFSLPHKNSNNKIINYIFIDDSFSNKYGIINNQERISLIDQIIDNISQTYPLKSKLKIATLKKGIIFDGFNSFDLKFSAIDSKIYQFNSMDNFLVKDSDYVNNIHFISNSNEVFINKSKKLLNDYDDKQKQFIFYHHIPDVDNNQYISNVRLIDNNNGLFYYEITIGNMFEEKSNFYLSAYKNSYNYDSSLILNQKIPLFNKQINLSPNSELRDTISIKLKPEYFSEILFKLEKIETQNDWVDDRLEDNYYSYIMDIPKEINASVIYNDVDDKKYISSILNSFQAITNNIDTNFFNIDYFYSNGVDKYSNVINNQNFLIFIGYNIFINSNSSIIDNFLEKEDSQIILFPSVNDVSKDKYILNISDSLSIDNLYINHSLENYDTIQFKGNIRLEYQNFINQKLKLYSYFCHQENQNTKFKVDSNSIWSRFKVGGSYFDLFGLVMNSGNNLFSSESIFSAPFLYSITLHEKIDYSKNNLFLNNLFNINDINSNRLKLVDLKGDSIIFYNNQFPIISTKSTKGLVSDNELLNLYSFNAIEDNFNKHVNIDVFKNTLNTKIIDYSNSEYSFDLNVVLNNNEITQYFIYFLFILLFLEMLLSNAKPSRSRY